MKSKNLRWVGLALILATGTSFLNAQENDGPFKVEMEAKKKEFKEKMKQELNLSQDQIAKIDQIDLKYQAEEEALRKEFEALKEKKKALMQKKKAEVEKILTPQQREKAKTLMEAKKVEMKGHMKRGMGGNK